ncbi:hypothetical protein F511_05723 [Dorcoceras hygrometricum]|uniref:SHSP domain-containing protein n=1 Tax=Dorcoceras hygrometricum TaxID=472368 RepID=A0A2Z7B8N7_9LAMI|nr:hypothetical protein F511_05723 [Dorcoceras hygrometricum]
MDAKLGDAAAQKNGYNEPNSDLIQEDDCDTLLIYLQGYRKDQLRVQQAKSGTLRVSGTRPIGDNKSSSFVKDYPVSPNCDTNNITAKFEGGILYIRQPKLIVPAEKGDENPPVLETQPARSPVNRRPPTPIPYHETKRTSSGEAQIKQQSLDGSEEGKNEKPDGIYDDQRAEPSVTDQHEEFSGNTESEFASKLTGKLGKDRVDYYKLVAAGTAAKMRKSGNIVYMVMAITLAFAFGMYVNNLIRSYKKPEN